MDVVIVSEIFKMPFRLGKKQKRAVLDADGHEVVTFPKGREVLAKEYVDIMNKKYNE
jgi:hypothetical protein